MFIFMYIHIYIDMWGERESAHAYESKRGHQREKMNEGEQKGNTDRQTQLEAEAHRE